MSLCNLWRNYHDIAINFASIEHIIRFYEENAAELSRFHGPGHWNDPDMVRFVNKSTLTIIVRMSATFLAVHSKINVDLASSI